MKNKGIVFILLIATIGIAFNVTNGKHNLKVTKDTKLKERNIPTTKEAETNTDPTQPIQKENPFYTNSDNNIPEKEKGDSINLDGLSSYLTAFKNAFKKEKILEIDSLFTVFLSNTSISRKSKRKLIWKMMKEANSDFMFKYLAETLGSMNPTEFSAEIISMIKETDSTFRKVELIKILDESLNLIEVPKITSTENLMKFLNQGSKVKSFLKNVLYNESNKDIFDAAFSSYESIESPQELVTIVTELLPNRETSLSKEIITNKILQKTFTDKSLQEDLLLEILSANYPKDEDFDDTLNYWTKEYGADSTSPHVKTLLLNRAEATIQDFSDQEIVSSGIQAAKLNNSILAIAELTKTPETTLSQAYVNYVIDNYALNADNPIKLTSAIASASTEALEGFKKRKNSVIPLLRNSLQYPEINTEYKELIKEIIVILDTRKH